MQQRATATHMHDFGVTLDSEGLVVWESINGGYHFLLLLYCNADKQLVGAIPSRTGWRVG